MTRIRLSTLLALLQIAVLIGGALLPFLPAKMPFPHAVERTEGGGNFPSPSPVIAAPVADVPAPKGGAIAPPFQPEPAMLASASGASDWSVAAANLHVQRSLERIRLEAVRRGTDPDAAAAEFLAGEVRNWRFAAWTAPAKRAEFSTWKRVDNWWTQQMSTGPGYAAPVEVPGTYGLLWQIDLRDYHWNASAWRAVAVREPYTRAVVNEHGKSVGVDVHQIDLLQRFIGEKRTKVVEKLLVNGRTVEVETYPSVGVVRADWLFRDTIETDRSPSYYDLLYARARFPAKTKQTVETYTERQPYTVRQWVWDASRGAYVLSEVTHYREVTHARPAKAARANQAVVDFPRDLNDWDEFWGVKALRDFAKKQKFDVRFGAVAAGSRSDSRGGSFVARNDRVIEIWDNDAMGTVDAARTNRRTDWIEQPVEIVRDEIDRVNGEFLARLPNGGQAMLLIARGKRIEFANGNFVHPRFQDTRNPDVRTPQCFVCHATAGGVIEPKNLFAEHLAAGIDLKIQDRVERNRVRAFMLDWKHKLERIRAPYNRLIQLATLDPTTGKSLSAAELVREFLAFRDWYDDPVSPAQAAWELGMPEAEFKRLAGKLTTARARALAHGLSVPREVWERDVYFWVVYSGGHHR